MDTFCYIGITIFSGIITAGATLLLLSLIHGWLVKRRYGPR